MKKPTRRNARVPAAAAGNETSTLPKLDTAPLSDIVHALANGRVTATSLTKFYLSRIEACDRGGPMLNSVREINPDAHDLGQARRHQAVGQTAAGGRPDSGEGQHRDR